MAERSVLNPGIRAATALAVMIAVMTSPIRPARPADDSHERICLRRNFAVLRVQPIRLSATSPAARAVCIAPLRSVDEPGMARPGKTPLDRAQVPAIEPAPALVGPGVLRARYALRC